MDKFQNIWKEQCIAARNVRVRHGILSALDYLIGEKLLTYAEMAVTRPEFARELPRFVAEVRDIFKARRSGTTSIILSARRRWRMSRPATRTTTNYLVTFPTDLPQCGRVSLS
jgi:hypothetical protein